MKTNTDFDTVVCVQGGKDKPCYQVRVRKSDMIQTTQTIQQAKSKQLPPYVKRQDRITNGMFPVSPYVKNTMEPSVFLQSMKDRLIHDNITMNDVNTIYNYIRPIRDCSGMDLIKQVESAHRQLPEQGKLFNSRKLFNRNTPAFLGILQMIRNKKPEFKITDVPKSKSYLTKIFAVLVNVLEVLLSSCGNSTIHATIQIGKIGNPSKPLFSSYISQPNGRTNAEHQSDHRTSQVVWPQLVSTNTLTKLQGGKPKSKPIATKERVTVDGRNSVVYMYPRGKVKYIKRNGVYKRL
jgi:hypothetical protein